MSLKVGLLHLAVIALHLALVAALFEEVPEDMEQERVHHRQKRQCKSYLVYDRNRNRIAWAALDLAKIFRPKHIC